MGRQPTARGRKLASLGLLVVGLLGLAHPAWALEELVFSPPAQLTNTTSGEVHDQLSSSSSGSRIAFIRQTGGTTALYTADPFRATAGYNVVRRPAGGGSGQYANPVIVDGGVTYQSTGTGRVETYLMRLPSEAVTQLTNNEPGSGAALLPINPASRVSRASATEDTDLVVYSSSQDGNPEIYVYDPAANRTYQVTNTTSGSNLHPVVASLYEPSGTAIAFLSNANLTGNNADGNYEVHLTIVQELDPDDCDGPTPPPDCDGAYDNTPPRFEPALSDQTVDEGQAVSFTVTGVDDDADELYLSATIENWAALGLASNRLSELGATLVTCDVEVDDACDPSVAAFSWQTGYTHGGRDYQLTFTADDGIDTGSQTITIRVNNINQVPVVNLSGSSVIRVGTGSSYSVLAQDTDGDPLSVTAVTLPSGATLSIDVNQPGYVQGTIPWSPTTPGTYTLTVRATDGTTPVLGSLDVQVVNNQDPELYLFPGIVAEGSALSLQIQALDPDGDPLTFSIVPGTIPAGAVFKPGLQLFSWVPWFNQAGTYTVGILVTDCRPGVTPPNCATTPVRGDLEIVVTDFPETDAIFSGTPGWAVLVPSGGSALLSVSVVNTGLETWTSTSGIALQTDGYYGSGEASMPAPVSLPAGQTVSTGQTATFTVRVVEPDSYAYVRWQMTQDGVPFGSATGWTTLVPES